MRTFSFVLPAVAALNLGLLVAGAASRPLGLAALGFQLPSLLTLLALVGIFRTTRAGQPAPIGFYLALGLTLLNYAYFAVVFSAQRPAH